jgi:hypothetical protein
LIPEDSAEPATSADVFADATVSGDSSIPNEINSLKFSAAENPQQQPTAGTD